MAPPTGHRSPRCSPQPGVVEQSTLASAFGFMAFHGGALEQRTDVIARMRGRGVRRVAVHRRAARA